MPGPTQTPPDDSAFSPGSGCFIMALAAIVLGGSAAFFVLQGFRMNRAIAGFTESGPAALPVAEPIPEERDALRARVQTFRNDALAGRAAELSLSAADINNLIASEPLLSDFRGNAEVVEISGEFLLADMSQPLNSLRPGRQRYLNARFHFRPRQIGHEFDLALVDITGAATEIPRGFIDLYTQKKFFKPDPENPAIGPVLERLSGIEIRGDRLVLSAGSLPGPP